MPLTSGICRYPPCTDTLNARDEKSWKPTKYVEPNPLAVLLGHGAEKYPENPLPAIEYAQLPVAVAL